MPVIVIPSSTGANTVFVNADTGRNVVLSGIGGQNSVILSGFKETPPHNSLVGLQGGSASQYYHLNSGQYFNLVTGQVVRPSDTGSFYPISNPSGYITGLDLSNYSTIPFSTGISGYLQNQVTNLNNQTGNYYLISNPSGYITGVNLSGYVTGDVIRPSDTGAFYPVSNPSGYITGINNIVYTTGDQSITGVKTFLSPPTISGNQVATVVDPVRTTLTGNGVLSSFAISGAGSLSNPSALIVAIDGALQEPTVDYGVSAGVITFTSPLANGAKAVVISPTNTLQVTEMIPADGSVTSTKLANDLEISGNLEVVGELTVSDQPALSASTAKGVVTNELFDERMMEIKPSLLQASVAAANSVQTTTQFLFNYGTMSFITPVANDAGIYAQFISQTISTHGNNLSSNNAGAGPMIDWRVNHILGFDLVTFKGDTARDAIARVVLGNVVTSGTNSARLGALASSSGYGIKMSKHPVNNTYQIQLVGRTCNSNNTNISGATNASPIVVTYNSHNLQNGDLVEITGVGGNTATNGVFTISGVTTNTFILNGSTGNGAYTSGGACQKISSEIVEVNPFTFYKFFIKWNYASRTITLHLGKPSAAASLTLTGLGVAQNATTYQLGTNIKIGMMAGADITGVGGLGINFNNPYIMINRY